MTKEIDKNTIEHGCVDNSLVAPRQIVENKPFDGDINKWDVADVVELAKKFAEMKYPRPPMDSGQWKLDPNVSVVVEEKIYGESMTAVYKTDASSSIALEVVSNMRVPSDDTPSGP